MKEFSNTPNVTLGIRRLFEMKIVERTFKMLDDTGIYVVSITISIKKNKKKF